MKWFWVALLAYCLIALYRTPGKGYGAKLLFFFDLFVCACIFRIPDITISSVCGLALRRPDPPWAAKAVSWFCNLFAANHCENAIQADAARARTALSVLEPKPTP